MADAVAEQQGNAQQSDAQQSDARRGEARVRVRYAETDQMGVVYHANYLVWFEVGRVELMRALGFDYRQLEAEEGCLIAVVEATARYKSPARYDDELAIRAKLLEARPSLLRFGYEVVRLHDETVLCTGGTTHVVVGRDMAKRRLPERYLQAFRDAVEPVSSKDREAAAASGDR